MNKTQAVEYLKNSGIAAMSVATLDRHRKEGRIVAGSVKGKTGDVVDFSEEVLQSYLKAELSPSSSLVTTSANVPQTEPTQALAKVPLEALPKGIQIIEVVDESSQGTAKPLMDLNQLSAKLMWNLDEASAMTGFSKGRIRDAIEAGELVGGRVGRPFYVHPDDVKEWLLKLRQSFRKP